MIFYNILLSIFSGGNARILKICSSRSGMVEGWVNFGWWMGFICNELEWITHISCYNRPRCGEESWEPRGKVYHQPGHLGTQMWSQLTCQAIVGWGWMPWFLGTLVNNGITWINHLQLHPIFPLGDVLSIHAPNIGFMALGLPRSCHLLPPRIQHQTYETEVVGIIECRENLRWEA